MAVWSSMACVVSAFGNCVVAGLAHAVERCPHAGADLLCCAACLESAVAAAVFPLGASAPCILGTVRAVGSDNCHDRVLFVFAPHSGAFGCPLLRLAGLCRRH